MSLYDKNQMNEEGKYLRNKSKTIRISRIVFLLLAAAFAACVFVQIYIAGAAIFIEASAWVKHIQFVHLFGFNLPIFMLIFALLGRMPRWAYWQMFGVFLSIFLMYFTANFNSVAPAAGPFHVIFAVMLMGLSSFIVIKTWQFIAAHDQTERRNES